MTTFDGHLYPSFGDYDANTGPIDVVSLNLATQVVGSGEVTLHTEQTWTMRVIDGALIVPFLDPQGSFDTSQGQYATAASVGSWSVTIDVTPAPEHVFDVAKTVDGLFLFGASGGTNGTIWRSTDDGATWAAALTIAGSEFARFYAVAQFDEVLLAFYDDATGSPRAYQWTANAWSEITSPGLVTETIGPFTYQGTEFYLGLPDTKNVGTIEPNLPVVIVGPDDGEQLAAITGSFPADQMLYDGTEAEGSFYLLTAAGDVLVGDDLGQWSTLLTLTDDTVRSIAVDPDGGYLYFGTTDSRILRTPIPT